MKRRVLSLLLIVCMILSAIPMQALAAEAAFSDTSGHWAQDAIESWAEREVLKGTDGRFRPDAPITRAELAAVLSRVIGYTAVTNTAFADVPSDAWYYGDVARLYAAGIMLGDGAGTMRPAAYITREEAVVLIARAFDVEENAGNISPFPDAADISGWAGLLVDGMKASGYISGDPSGRFNPKADITRAEVVTILDNMVTLYFGTPMEYDCELIGELSANALVNTAGAAIKNLTLDGNLWITEGVSSGDVSLDNVSVSGTTYIRGGGPNSIRVNGGRLGIVIMSGTDNTRLSMSRETKVARVFLNASGSILHGTAGVAYDAQTGTMTFSGTIDELTLNEDGTATAEIGGIIYDIIPEKRAGAPDTTFDLAPGTVVKNVVVNAPVLITGTGKIEQMEVHSPGVVISDEVDVDPENIIVDKGISIIIGGEEYVGDGGPLPSGSSGSSDSDSGPARIRVTGVSIFQDSIVLSVDENGGDTLQLTATVEPENATNQNVNWHSADESVATVDQTGLVTAVARGETVITVTTADRSHTDTVEVNVLGELDKMQPTRLLTAHASYDPFADTVYLDWVSTEESSTFNIYKGDSADNLTQEVAVNGSNSYSIENPDIQGDSLYLEVRQPLTDGETLSSGVLTLEFDDEGLVVPGEGEEEDMAWLADETDPTLLDSDGDGLSDAMEAFLTEENYGSFDSKDAYSYTGDGQTLDGDVLLSYTYYLNDFLETPLEDFLVTLTIEKMPARYIDLLSLADESEGNPFFGEDIYGYVGAPAVRIDFPSALFDEVDDITGQEITLSFDITGSPAAKFISTDRTAAMVYFNDSKQLFEDVVFDEDTDGQDYIMTAALEHFSYYTVIDVKDHELTEVDEKFDVDKEFDSTIDTDIVFLIPKIESHTMNYPEEDVSAPLGAVRRLINSYGDNLYYTGAMMNKHHIEDEELPKFTNSKTDGAFSPLAYTFGLMDVSFNSPADYGLYIARALSIFFDTEYLPNKTGNTPWENFSFKYVDSSYKSKSTSKALVVIATPDEIKGTSGDTENWDWTWVTGERAGSSPGGVSGKAPQEYLDGLGVELYLVSYGGEWPLTLMESFKTNDLVHTYYARNADELDAVMDEIAYAIGTVDVTTDSNNDGISDFFTERICKGSLRLGTGAPITDDDGELLDYDTFQNKRDYDDDGIPNNEEISVAFDTNGHPFLVMRSNPGRKDTNGNEIYDADDPHPLVAWKATTALARIVDNAGFIYLEPGTNYNGKDTGDFLYARIDARQKNYGYCYAYDESIMAVSSAILCEPIYFFYDGKEWLIEMWKGQYGIETGAEIGVYNRTNNMANLGPRVAENISRMIEQEVRAAFGSLLDNAIAEGIFEKVMEPVRAIATATPGMLISAIDTALSVVRSNAVYVPLKTLLGQSRTDTIINAFLAAKNFVSCKFYECVNEEEYLNLSIKLTNTKGKVLFERNNTDHWWLTGFKWGEFTGDLGAISCELKINFKDREMMDAFLNGMADESSDDYNEHGDTYAKMKTFVPRLDDNNNDNDGAYGLREQGYSPNVSGNTVSFTFKEAKTTQPYAAMLNPAVLAWNRVLVSSYNALLYVLDIDTIDPNAIEEKLLAFDSTFGKEMFERFIDGFGNLVPSSLRSKDFDDLTTADKAFVKARLAEVEKTVFAIIDGVSNAIFTIADKLVGPPS